MTQAYDKVERDMGISSFMSTVNHGFAAVLKARYSDFVVHEGEVHGIQHFACLRLFNWRAPCSLAPD
jgi:hypothetical protein